MSEAKPYDISKRLVWKAWKQVKENQGAAGVDGVSLAAFEKDLKGNLYKIWNRMSSGSYLPPPVRLMEIPKANGGVRPLGIPTVADRVAQTVVKMVLSQRWSLYSILALTAIDPAARRSMRWERRASAVGSSIGLSISISDRSLIRFRMI
jgi:retron-type reverse transcriptase